MKKTSLFLGVILSIFTLGSCSNSSNTDSVEQAKDINEEKDSSNATMAMDEDDAKFMVDAANGGMMEVEMGTLAQQKAMDQRVKDFGAMMVRDHTKANDELKALAATKNVTLPAMMGDDMQKKMNDMREKKSGDFDEAYMDMMESDHKHDVDMFEKKAENGKDADLKAWASSTLMTLRMHRDSAEYIHKVIKDKK
jgi:putative membrane protein